MGLFATLLILPFLAVSVGLIVWICRRSPAGWKRFLVGATVACVLAPLAYLGWWRSTGELHWGTYTCLVCGRTEWHECFASWIYSRKLVDDGAEYQRRFQGAAALKHEHEWNRESSGFGLCGLSCSRESVGGWFRTLPRLSNREAVDAVFAEANALPERERHILMNDVTRCIELAAPFDEMTLDAEFARWQEQRRR